MDLADQEDLAVPFVLVFPEARSCLANLANHLFLLVQATQVGQLVLVVPAGLGILVLLLVPEDLVVRLFRVVLVLSRLVESVGLSVLVVLLFQIYPVLHDRLSFQTNPASQVVRNQVLL